VYPDVWKFYEEMLQNFWVPSEIDYENDKQSTCIFSPDISETAETAETAETQESLNR